MKRVPASMITFIASPLPHRGGALDFRDHCEKDEESSGKYDNFHRIPFAKHLVCCLLIEHSPLKVFYRDLEQGPYRKEQYAEYDKLNKEFLQILIHAQLPPCISSAGPLQ